MGLFSLSVFWRTLNGYFLGLLAGLHEFPTTPNVKPDMPSAEMQKVIHTMLCDLLAVAPRPSSGPSKRQNGTTSTAEEESAKDKVRIASVKSVGNVIHVFSHIRKTYRVQWVVLEGASTPPVLKTSPFPSATTKRRKGKKATVEARVDALATEINGEVQNPDRCRWTPLDQVSNAKYVTDFVAGDLAGSL
jgi:A/G-specific adenine glycosylase